MHTPPTPPLACRSCWVSARTPNVIHFHPLPFRLPSAGERLRVGAEPFWVAPPHHPSLPSSSTCEGWPRRGLPVLACAGRGLTRAQGLHIGSRVGGRSALPSSRCVLDRCCRDTGAGSTELPNLESRLFPIAGPCSLRPRASASHGRLTHAEHSGPLRHRERRPHLEHVLERAR